MDRSCSSGFGPTHRRRSEHLHRPESLHGSTTALDAAKRRKVREPVQGSSFELVKEIRQGQLSHIQASTAGAGMDDSMAVREHDSEMVLGITLSWSPVQVAESVGEQQRCRARNHRGRERRPVEKPVVRGPKRVRVGRNSRENVDAGRCYVHPTRIPVRKRRESVVAVCCSD